MVMLRHVLLVILLQSSIFFASSYGQDLQVEGSASIGVPGDGNTLLTLVSERNWSFRQFSTGPSTALELADLTGMKNFIINTTGNIGIGKLIPTAKLDINGSIICEPRVTFGSAEYIEDGGSFEIGLNGTTLNTLDATDDLGKSTNRWRTIYALDGVINTSDARAKSNIKDMTYGLNEILQLHPVSFNWKDHPESGVKMGLVAQQVQDIIPEVVVDYDRVRDEITGAITKKPAQQLGIYYADLIPVLIKSIQQQQQIIQDDRDRIATLESKAKKVDALEKKLEELELHLIQNEKIESPKR